MRGALATALLTAAPGCVAVAHPPEAPAEPVEVFLLRQGAHTGVVLPAAEGAPGTWVEYAFGAWSWYGEQRDGTLNGLRALAMTDAAALGRRYADEHPASDPLLRRRGATVEAFAAESARVAALRASLDAEFAASAAPPRLLERNGLWVAQASSSYALDSNCCDATLSWMESLGCRVFSPGITRGIALAGAR